MLNRQKLKRIGVKHEREVIDDDYGELLATKLILLGAQYAEVRNEGWRIVVIPRDPSQTLGYGVPRSRVMTKRDGNWIINTKKVHDFLTWHAGGKYET